MFDRRDPLPGVVFGLRILRHPRRLLRTMTRDVEAPAAERAPAAVRDAGASSPVCRPPSRRSARRG
jgi:hypothetical protein